MKIHNHFINCVLVTVFVSFSTLAVMAEDTAPEALVLQKIMADLGEAMQAVTDGISREDWPFVETSAASIAVHPTPPMSEKVQILAYMGSNMSQFKAHDNKTHLAAVKLGKRAGEEDGVQVITAFAELQQTCLSCHQRFRKSLKNHFYGSPK